MHESHQVQKLIAEVQKLADERRLKKVSRVTVLIGELLGFDETSMRLHWDEFVEGTPLAGAELTVRFLPAKLLCPKCSALFSKKGSDLSCPSCRVLGTPTAAGKELLVESVSG